VLLKCFSPGCDIRKKLSIVLEIYSVSTVKEGGASFKLGRKNKRSEIVHLLRKQISTIYSRDHSVALIPW